MYASCEGIEIEKAREAVTRVISDGSALKKLREMVVYQGGDPSVIDNPDNFEKSKYIYEVKSPVDGFITKTDTEKIGLASVVLGAGREKKGDPIDYKAGIVLSKKTGAYVRTGDVIATLHTDLKDKIPEAETMILSALTFGDEEPPKEKLIYEIVGG